MSQPNAKSVLDCFPVLRERLLTILRELEEDEWRRRDPGSGRSVHTIVCHLLDGSLRRLSAQRDGHLAPEFSGLESPRESELMAVIDTFNDRWTLAAARLSPRILIELIDRADSELIEFFSEVDPEGEDLYAVAWAGEDVSKNWFDIAREFTEKWHHTQQIFGLSDRPSTITTRALLYPVLDTFSYALPHTFRNVDAAPGTLVRLTVEGDAGGAWQIIRSGEGWLRSEDSESTASATVRCAPLSAWRMYTRREPAEALLAACPDVELRGDRSLAEHLLGAVAMMV